METMGQQPQWDVSGLLTHLNKLHNDEVATAKHNLAEKVLARLRREAEYYDGMRLTDYARGGKQKLRDVTEAVERLIAAEGIQLTTPQDKER
jgi:hypothetical protein